MRIGGKLEENQRRVERKLESEKKPRKFGLKTQRPGTWQLYFF
jgi:hypothetical protein